MRKEDSSQQKSNIVASRRTKYKIQQSTNYEKKQSFPIGRTTAHAKTVKIKPIQNKQKNRSTTLNKKSNKSKKNRD
jgi:hypothetical protein